MFNNEFIADRLRLLRQLLELKGENPFKTRAYDKAADLIDSFEVPVTELLASGELKKTEGFGEAILKKVQEIADTGTCPALQRLEEEIPAGVIAMFKIKGLGPKKIEWVWQKMGITTVGELYQACTENRLKDEKGFGEKTQEKIRESIEFVMANESRFHYATLFPYAQALLKELEEISAGDFRFSLAGEIRRKLPVLDRIEILVEGSGAEVVKEALAENEKWEVEEGEEGEERMSLKWKGTTVQAEIQFSGRNYIRDLWKATGSLAHLAAMQPASGVTFETEEELYRSAGLDWVAPELREGNGEVELARAGTLPRLVEYADIRGSLHNHSTWSDGVHSIAEMAEACRKEGWEYFGISDHSQTAFYANGLKPERVLEQVKEIDKLNSKHPGFRIFKGIESDILQDGSLDYEDLILAEFDFVVASIHGQFPSDEDKATSRLIRAIENPFTTILGHPTGRLLLVRDGYPINHKKVIDACAANGVIIEINASPYRLDIDWQWIPYCLEKGVLISINPDAHKTGGLKDTFWGLEAARKGGLTREMTFNAKTAAEVAAWFAARKA